MKTQFMLSTCGLQIVQSVTFRVAEAKGPSEVLTMIGNGGCEFEDPSGVNLLPYFWRAGTGDGAEHVFLYAAYCGLEGGVDGFAFGGAGGTVAMKNDSTSPGQEKIAHGGLRYLEIIGQKPQAMCPAGLGFWGPGLPARPDDTVEAAFHVRGWPAHSDGPRFRLRRRCPRGRAE
jgi:hypothetical protein